MTKPSARPLSPICVLGMHRSGTSCLAGCLEHAGVFLGDVVNHSPHNRKGNKESKSLRAINEDLLALNGGSWDHVPTTLTWNAGLQARRDAHIANFRVIPLWGFKDPRCVLTLPFWREALPEMRFVATFRHPAAVVRSLSKRSGLISETAPLQLWIDYNQILLRLCRTETVPLICFDWPDEAYLAALGKLAIKLGLTTGGVEQGFFESELRNPAVGWPASRPREDQSIVTQAEDLYQTLLRQTHQA